MNIAEALALAVRHHQAGHLQQAEDLYRQVLQADPQNADAWHLLGVALHHAGRNAEAVEHIRRALALDRAQAVFHGNLGLAYAALGRIEEALASYQEALRLQPDYANAHNNLGALLHSLGRFTEAETAFRRAVRIRPDFADAHNNLGTALKAQSRFAEAVLSYRESLRLRPNYPAACSNLGAALAAQGQITEAIAWYEQALRLDPNHAEAHNNLGVALHRQGRLADAILCCRQAVQLKPVFTNASKNLATFLQEQGDWAEALACLEQAQAQAPSDALKIKAALTLPIIYASAEEMHQQRRRVKAALDRLREQPLAIPDPFDAIGTTSFELAYQGLNDRDLQAALAAIHARATPTLNYLASHCTQPTRAAGRPIRIGFLSRFFHNHTIGRLNLGLIRHLSRTDFHVTLLRLPGKDDTLARSLQESADAVVALPEHLELARTRVAEERLDVLYYTDIGMDPLTHLLAFARLAPVQCVTWGHPMTTGIPAIDYFLSSELLEADGAEAHYTEKLIRHETLNTFYYRPAPPTPAKGRDQLGLPERAHLYGCPQTLFKFHPEFDDLLGAILRRDPFGLLVLITGKHASWDLRLRARFARTIPDVAERIRFLPRLTHEDFLSLNTACDVLLDPIHFGGGNTAYEALALGVPIVTWPSAFLRGRITYALYKKMDFLDCVAWSAEEYVERTVRLGTEPDYRAEIRAKILAANGVLYEETAAVRELEEFLKEAVAQS
jgi:predicted O-linked N-acetylglucosamine transferase (SPINDLY family)